MDKYLKYLYLLFRFLIFPFAWLIVADANVKLYKAIALARTVKVGGAFYPKTVLTPDQANLKFNRELSIKEPITEGDKRELYLYLSKVGGGIVIIDLWHWTKSFLSLDWANYKPVVVKNAYEEILLIMSR